MKTQASNTHSIDQAFAASLAAFRINGARYLKLDELDAETRTVRMYKRNADLMLDLLAEPTLITEADHAQVSDMKMFFQALVFKVLKDGHISDFENKMLVIASAETANSKDIAIIAYMSSHYSAHLKRRVTEDRLESATREYVAPVAAKVSLTIDIVKITYSDRYGSNLVSALTSDNNRVFFFHSGSDSLVIDGRREITATVKRHDDKFTTVLTRVKFKKT